MYNSCRLFVACLSIAYVLCGITSSDLFAKEYKNDYHKMNLFYNDAWLSVPPEERYVLLTLIHEQAMATINVSAYTYMEAITVNAFQDRRRAKGYDGWVNMGERDATEYELQRANVEASRLAIYSKKVLDDQLSVEHIIVAEYYYVKGKKGFVVSIRTSQQQWKHVKSGFKSLVESFWVGEGTQPQVVKKDVVVSDWKMIGRNAQNHNSIESNFVVTDNIKSLWQYTFDDFDVKESSINPLFVKGSVFFHSGSDLVSVSVYDGTLNWSIKTSGPISKSLCYQNGFLYFVVDEDPPQLVAVQGDTGQRVFNTPLQSDDYTHPVISGSSLYLVDSGDLKSFDISTGELKWSVKAGSKITHHPVVKDRSIVVVDRQNTIKLYDAQTGDLLWLKVFVQPLTETPIIYKDMILLTLAMSGNRGSEIRSIHLQEGREIWRYDFSGQAGHVIFPPAVSQDTFYCVVDGGGKHVYALDVNTGVIAWGYAYESSFSPVVTNSSVYLLEQKLSGLVLNTLNKRTGLIDQTLSMSDIDGLGRHKLLFVRPYKSYLYAQLIGATIKMAVFR